MINVVFFAQTRELVGTGSMTVNESFSDVAALRTFLAQKSERWALALNPEQLLVAVNQEIVSLDTPIKSGDEVAFFPPVTGG